MLQLDYALLCDYVRADSGLAHVIAAGIDTIYRPEVPAVANLGFLARFTFTDEDLGQDHELELHLDDSEGQRVAQLTGAPPLQPVQGLPNGWAYGGIVAINFGVPLPSHGPYTLTILLDGTLVNQELSGFTGSRQVGGSCRLCETGRQAIRRDCGVAGLGSRHEGRV